MDQNLIFMVLIVIVTIILNTKQGQKAAETAKKLYNVKEQNEEMLKELLCYNFGPELGMEIFTDLKASVKSEITKQFKPVSDFVQKKANDNGIQLTEKEVAIIVSLAKSVFTK